MFNSIKDETATQTALAQFQEKIKSLAVRNHNQEWVFPSGGKEIYETYTLPTETGELTIGLGGDWNGREAHLFNIEKDANTLTPNLEINIPRSYNANVGGLFIEHDNRIALAHRGIFNAFRGRIPKSVTLNHFKDNFVQVDGNAEVLLITYLDSDTLADDIALFVASVLDFKNAYKNGDLDD